ncbi:MAG: hypothetical protein ACLFV0_04595 [Nitriliruptoraceae bacterium]
MSTPSAPVPPPSGPPPSGPPPPSAGRGAQGAASTAGTAHTRSLAALVAAALVLVGTVVLVLVFGLARPPQLPSLAADPEPDLPGVAWMSWDRGTCLLVAGADGAVDEVACGLQGGEVVGWDADGIATAVRGPSSGGIELLDPDTGEVVDTQPLADDAAREPATPSGRSETRTVDGVLTVNLDGTVLWATEAPEAYWVEPGSLSPDGRWVAAFDSADRLLVLDATGAQPPRVWLEGVEGWRPPVWEGTPVPSSGG